MSTIPVLLIVTPLNSNTSTESNSAHLSGGNGLELEAGSKAQQHQGSKGHCQDAGQALYLHQYQYAAWKHVLLRLLPLLCVTLLLCPSQSNPFETTTLLTSTVTHCISSWTHYSEMQTHDIQNGDNTFQLTMSQARPTERKAK